jgi:hypothetical protein
MSLKVVRGIDDCVAAFRLLNEGTRTRMKGAVRQTTEEVRADAARRVPVSGPDSRKAKGRPGPGELRDTIRTEYAGDGLRGYVEAGYGKLTRRSRAGRGTRKGQEKRNVKIARARKARSLASRGLGNYAKVVEFGSPAQGKAAQPYMRPAREAAIPRHQARVEAALRDATVAAGGSA